MAAARAISKQQEQSQNAAQADAAIEDGSGLDGLAGCSDPRLLPSHYDCLVVIGGFGLDCNRFFLKSESFPDLRDLNQIPRFGSDPKHVDCFVWERNPEIYQEDTANASPTRSRRDQQPFRSDHAKKALFQVGRSNNEVIDFVVRDVGKLHWRDRRSRTSTSETGSVYSSIDSQDSVSASRTAGNELDGTEQDGNRGVDVAGNQDDLFDRIENYALTDNDDSDTDNVFDRRNENYAFESNGSSFTTITDEKMDEDGRHRVLKYSVSRLACRIFVELEQQGTGNLESGATTRRSVARIFAGAFQRDGRIFVGKGAKVWVTDQLQQQRANNFLQDAFTTNGTWFWRPLCDPTQAPRFADPHPAETPWMQVSVLGNVYTLANKRDTGISGNSLQVCKQLPEEDNFLVDFSLIYLSGVTLLWRSATGIARGTTDRDILRLMVDFCDREYECPVTLERLVLYTAAKVDDQLLASLRKENGWVDDRAERDHAVLKSIIGRQQNEDWIESRSVHVYLACGHVMGPPSWDGATVGNDGNQRDRTCPHCRKKGPIAMLKMGIESAVWLDSETASHAFNPCGHITSEKTVRYWIKVAFPHGKEEFLGKCPFCAEKIRDEGYVKLIFL